MATTSGSFRGTIALIAVLMAACANPEEAQVDKLTRTAPGLSREAANHLLFSDDRKFHAYCDEIGFRGLLEIATALREAMDYTNVESYRRSADYLMPIRKRVFLALADVFGWTAQLDRWEFLDGLPPERAIANDRLQEEAVAITYDESLNESEKLSRTLEMLDDVIATGDRFFIAQCKGYIAGNLLGSGNPKEGVEYLKASTEDCREAGYFTLLCQNQGVLGSLYDGWGNTDSMTACYDEALAVAMRHRDPHNAARILSFYAAHYSRGGRLSLAHEFHKRAQNVCRELKGGVHEMRYIISTMSFHASLESWDVVQRLAQRARAFEHSTSLQFLDNPDFGSLLIRQYEARYLMSIGRVDEAHDVFESIDEGMSRVIWLDEYPRFLLYWAEGLRENGRAADALLTIDRARAYIDSIGDVDLKVRVRLQRAIALFQLERLDEAESSLADFVDFVRSKPGREHKYREEWIEHGVLETRIAVRRGDRERAIKSLGATLTRLRGQLQDTDAAVHGYLWAGKFDTVRQVLHDLVSDDETLGYGVEIYWRELVRSLGRTGETSTEPHDLVHEVRQDVELGLKRVSALNAIHCAYVTREREVWRWTVHGGAVRRDVLPMTSVELSDRVSRIKNLMTATPSKGNDAPSDELTSLLVRLGEALLPPELDQDGRLFLVTTDGALGELPFEALGLPRRPDYTPVLAKHDVAYVRHVDAVTERPKETQGVVVAVTTPSRTSGLNGYAAATALHATLEEGRAVAALDERTVFLSGADATKANLLRAWQGAPFIYLAAHVVKDPVAPFLRALPLAPDPDATAPDADYLDFQDVLAADLSACKLAVLSGCSSGAPYTGPGNTAPSLADVFLDAGAACVIQTFWDVSDDDALKFMRSFVARWNTNPLDAVKNLCDARREIMLGQDGIRHPYYWAAYSAKLGRF